MDEWDEKEARAERLADEGHKADAVRLLYEGVVACAKARRFSAAERLRAALMRIDPMALVEIVHSAEIIEAEKAAGLDPAHLELWAALYGNFLPDERNALFYALQKLKVEPGTEVLCQGKLNSRLFLVNRGRLRVVVRQGERETFLKEVGAGEIVGVDTFFPITVCTHSVLAGSGVELSVLERKDLLEIEASFAGFEAKLEDSCRRAEKKTVEDILKEKEVERRRFSRHRVNGRVHVQIVDKDNQPTGASFNGHLEDLSSGGASFMIKCSQKSIARSLLGRRALFRIEFENAGRRMELTASGLILGAVFQLFNDYSIHVRFGKNMSEEDVRRILAAMAGEV